MKHSSIDDRKEVFTNKIKENEELLFSMRFKYAWDWFDLHAKQRMNLFNYFFIVTGILLNSYVLAFNYKLFPLAATVCIIGMFQTLAFRKFDIRNRQLISYAEDILEKIEREYLFPQNFNHPEIKKGNHLGILYKDSTRDMREGQTRKFSQNLEKMKWWMRAIYSLFFFTFLAGLIYLIFYYLFIYQKQVEVFPEIHPKFL